MPKIAGRQAPGRAKDPTSDVPVDDRKAVDRAVGEPPAPVEHDAVEPAPVEPAPVELGPTGAVSGAPADAEADAASTAPARETADGDATEPPPGRPVNRTSALRPRSRDDATGVAVTAPVSAAERAGWRSVAVIGIVAVALAAFAAVAAFRPGATLANRAWVDTAETTRVSAAARDAIQTLYTYKFDTVDQDFDNARAVLTDDMRTQFDETAQVTRDAVTQTKTATNAQVTDIGVKLLDDDRAELVASMNVSASNDGVEQGSAEGPLSVTMARVDGTWLLSDIRDR
ncbi:hypothetical protein ACWF62_09915 [Rhodococcus sp. NPDC054953]